MSPGPVSESHDPDPDIREVTCVWCDHKFTARESEQKERLWEHAEVCEKHPVRELTQENARLTAELKQARDEVRRLKTKGEVQAVGQMRLRELLKSQVRTLVERLEGTSRWGHREHAGPWEDCNLTGLCLEDRKALDAVKEK